MLFDHDIEIDKAFEVDGLGIEHFDESFDILFFIIDLMGLLFFSMQRNGDWNYLAPVVQQLFILPVDKFSCFFPSFLNSEIDILNGFVDLKFDVIFN